MKIGFAGVPKSIDNDIPFVDSTFGFETCCEEAGKFITSGYLEATGIIDGIGLIKVMGRHSGYIAMMAALCNSQCDFCIIPENPWELAGPNGLIAQVYERMQE